MVPDGVELADGSLAGRGDLVVSRRNERLLPTSGGAGAYVRNGDRWVVQATGQDGNLVVRHAKRGWQVVLPASYVAADVELGYATTAHQAQGRTVERAEVLVRPADSRWYLYVAMSRARDQSVAHVVVEETEDEPHGYHPRRAAREVLEQVLANDEPVSAAEHTRAARAAQTDPGLVAERWRTARAEELRARLGRALAPQWGEVLAGTEGWRVVEAAGAAEAMGLDAGAVVAGAGTGEVGELVTALDEARFSGRDSLAPPGRCHCWPGCWWRQAPRWPPTSPSGSRCKQSSSSPGGTASPRP